MILFLAGLDQIPTDLLDAARVDGAGAWQAFWRIIFPLLMPVMLFIVVTGSIAALQEFGVIYAMTLGSTEVVGGPVRATTVFSILLYLTAFSEVGGFNYSYGGNVGCHPVSADFRVDAYPVPRHAYPVGILIAMVEEKILASTRYRNPSYGRQREIVTYWLSLFLVTFGALVMIVPFVFMVITSLKTQADIIAIPAVWLPSQLTLDNFVQVWNRTQLLRSLINTAYVAIVITVATVFSSSLMGFVFSKYEFRGRDVIFAISLAGMMLPFYVISIPLYLMIHLPGLGELIYGADRSFPV